MENKAYKYRIYPTQEQKIFFMKTFGCCRKIWNLMLEDKINFYQATGKMLHNTPAQYKEAYPFLKEVDSLALANVQLQLQKAYKAFFETPGIGFPKYKSIKHSRFSYTTNNQNGTIQVLEDSILLPKIKKIKARIHRDAPDNWKIKSVTVSMERDGSFYASVLYEYKEAEELCTVKEELSAVGLDYKSDGLYVSSDGEIAGSPKYFKQSEEKLAKRQRKLKHKVVGSKNYQKQQKRIARVHRKIANQRTDYLQKKSTEIANRYDVVCVESLNMKSMSNHGFHNGKATMDNGYGKFLNMLEYKLKDRGKQFVKVDKWYPSSQLCSCCGRKKKMPLNIRAYQCECGMIMDRDLNASINIKREGLRQIA